MSITLSDSELEFVQRQVAGSKFSSPSEYVQALLRAEMELQEEPAEVDPQLEAELLKGLNSGPRVRADDEFWKRLLATAHQRGRSIVGK